jgi:L-threonylcarbamoyladenylate synthase
VKTEIVSAVRAGPGFSGSEADDPSQTGATVLVRAEPSEGCEKAIEFLRAGEIVALPTETVYGLAADALNPGAVAKIFEAKERPRFDPLIVHLPNRGALDEFAIVESPIARDLIEKFWPGPLTIVFRKRDVVPDIVTAGLETVAVRMSAHPVFRGIASALNRPLAAPSANRFGRVSPTTAQHVLDELSGRIPLIVDGGLTEHGIESTIVRIVDGVIEVLRRGPITGEMLHAFGEVREWTSTGAIIAPGQSPTHYAPKTKLILVEDLNGYSVPSGKRVGALAFYPVAGVGDLGPRSATAATDAVREVPNLIAVRHLSERRDVREAAANLFRMLRELDAENLDVIVAERVPEQGIGAAINDRLRRASNSPSSRA